MSFWGNINWGKIKFKKCNDYGNTITFKGGNDPFDNIAFTNVGIKQFSKGLIARNSPYKLYSQCPYCDMGTALIHESGCPNNPNQTIYVDS
jgi:hypothetical protein